MTLEECEKERNEKRKALLALNSEERKVDFDKDFESMKLLSSKKNEEEIQRSDKGKEVAEKAKAKKVNSLLLLPWNLVDRLMLQRESYSQYYN